MSTLHRQSNQMLCELMDLCKSEQIVVFLDRAHVTSLVQAGVKIQGDGGIHPPKDFDPSPQ